MSLECHTNILPLRVFEGVTVVFDVTRLCCEDGVIAAHCAILSRKPVRPTLAKDDVTRDHVFFSSLFLRLIVCLVHLLHRLHVLGLDE